MLCMICHQHATLEHTVFQGTTPTKIKLCDACRSKTAADEHVARIKAAPDHDAKNAAVTGFLAAVGAGSGSGGGA